MTPPELDDGDFGDGCPSGALDHETFYTFDDGEDWSMECRLCGAEWWGSWDDNGPSSGVSP